MPAFTDSFIHTHKQADWQDLTQWLEVFMTRDGSKDSQARSLVIDQRLALEKDQETRSYLRQKALQPEPAFTSPQPLLVMPKPALVGTVKQQFVLSCFTYK